MSFQKFSGALVAGLVAVALLSGCAGKKDPTFEAADYQKDKAAVTAKYVTVVNPKALAKATKKSKKVFIPLFQVEFINQSSAASSSYSFASNGGSSSVNVTYKLTGVDTAAFSTLVDKLYADFTADLTAAGYEVVDKNTLVTTPQYQQLKTRGEASNPVELASRTEGTNKALVVAPSGMGVVYFSTFSQPPSTVKTLWKALKGDLPEASAAALADSLQASPVLVQMVVGFASLKDSHAKGSGNSSVSAEYRFAVAAVHSKIAIFGDDAISHSGKNKNRWNINATQGSVAQLSKPVFGANGWVIGRRDITSTGSKVAEGVGNAIGILAAAAGGGGGAHTSKTRIYALDADPVKYGELARDNLGYTQEMLLYGLTHPK